MISKHNLTRLALILPFMIPLLLFWILPLLSGFAISLTDWDYISPTFNIVGIDNYTYIITDSDFIKALINTIIFGVGTIFPTIALGLAFALLLQKSFQVPIFIK